MADDINEFLMSFNSSSSNDNAFGVEDSGLEFLDDVGAEVVHVASEPLNWHSEVASSEGSLEDVVGEDLISAQMGLQLVAVGVFVHSDA